MAAPEQGQRRSRHQPLTPVGPGLRIHLLEPPGSCSQARTRRGKRLLLLPLLPAPTRTASTHQRCSQPTPQLALTWESSARVASRISIDTELQAFSANVAAQRGHARGEGRRVGSQAAVDPGGL